MDPLEVVLVAPPGPQRDRILSAASGTGIQVLDSLAAFRSRGDEGWGVLLLGTGIPAEDVLAVNLEQAERERPWATVLVGEEGGEILARPISIGLPVPLTRIQEIASQPDEKGPILELHWVLRVVAKARHDLNNPLTSGLAEAQLLLMDEHPEEVRSSLDTIQDQFRRLRDMVADLSRLRVQRKNPFGR